MLKKRHFGASRMPEVRTSTNLYRVIPKRIPRNVLVLLVPVRSVSFTISNGVSRG